MTGQLSVDQVRRTGMWLLGAVTLLLAALTLGGGLVGRSAGALAAGVAALALAIRPVLFALQRRTDATARLIASTSAIAMPALLLVAARGQAWPVDCPMMFFAVLAMIALLCDWRAIAAGPLVVMGMIALEWMFDGRSAAPAQPLMHAVVLMMEAGALIWLTVRTSPARWRAYAA